MMKKLQLILRYLIYLVKSRNEYLIHSPFVYDFVTNVIYKKTSSEINQNIEKWRQNFTGVSYDYDKLKFHLFGAVDDIWINLDNDELILVDYKSTSKSSEITLDAEWQMGYKRQMEFYQYLLRNNGFNVSDTGYFVYCNGIRDKEMFNESLEFKMSLISYTGSDSWVEPTLKELHSLLNQDSIPEHNPNCDYCKYQLNTSID